MASSGSLLKPTVVPVDATAGGTVLLAANGKRLAAILRNLGDSASEPVYVGDSTVTVGNGTPLENGQSAGRRGDTMTIPGSAEIRAIAGAGPVNVSVLEITD